MSCSSSALQHGHRRGQLAQFLRRVGFDALQWPFGGLEIIAPGLVLAHPFDLFLRREFETLHANAQSSLSDRVWKAAYSVISTVSDPNAKITIWRLKRPISFSLIEPTRAADVESLIGNAVLPATVDSACIERQLKKLTEAAAAPTTESNLDTLIAQRWHT